MIQVQMFVSSIILYFGENPVGYDVYRFDEGFSFQPARDSRSYLTPQITATLNGDEWEVAGVEQQDVIEQVLKFISIDSMFANLGKLSAAS